MATVLLFENDDVVAKKLCDSLKKEQYEVTRCDENEPDALLALPQSPALALLDASLKWTACRPLFALLERMECPILFITADRRMSAHLRALYAGRSDVLTLPFTLKGLHAKAQLLLSENAQPRELSVDEKARVALLDGRRVELTAQEFSLLLALMEKPDIPVSREQLLRKAWGYQSMGETRTVDVHVQRLRKKLGGECIETVYKCGYRLKLA